MAYNKSYYEEKIEAIKSELKLIHDTSYLSSLDINVISGISSINSLIDLIRELIKTCKNLKLLEILNELLEKAKELKRALEERLTELKNNKLRQEDKKKEQKKPEFKIVKAKKPRFIDNKGNEVDEPCL